MKTITRSIIYLPMAAMILTAAPAVPAAAQKQVPFKGALQGNDTDQGLNSEGKFLVATSGTGIGTLVGQFSFTLEIAIDLGNFTDSGSAHWIAANGDSIYATFTGFSEPAGGLFSITETFTITGGTGRFAGAQGSFIVERLADPNKFVTYGSFHGTITSPGAAH